MPASTDELILRTMSGVALFRHLPRAVIVRLLQTAGKSVFQAGETVFEEGGEGQSLYVAVAGRFEVFRTLAGRAVHLADIDPGNHFGEISLITRRPRTASVRALEDSVAIRLTREAVLAEKDAALQLFQNMAILLAAHLADANEEILCHTAQQHAFSPHREDRLPAPPAPVSVRR